MNDNNYIKALKRVVWAYLILFFNFNIGTLNIIPDWLAYIFFYKAIIPIGKYEKSALLLKPIAVGLGIIRFIEWSLAIFGISLDVYVLNLILTAICLYFNFQLLTNIADIAKKSEFTHTKRLYVLRNLKTIFVTISVLPFNWQTYDEITIIFVLITFVFEIFLCISLNQYANYEKRVLYLSRLESCATK